MILIVWSGDVVVVWRAALLEKLMRQSEVDIFMSGTLLLFIGCYALIVIASGRLVLLIILLRGFLRSAVRWGERVKAFLSQSSGMLDSCILLVIGCCALIVDIGRRNLKIGDFFVCKSVG